MSSMQISSYRHHTNVGIATTPQTLESLRGNPTSNDPCMRFYELHRYDVKEGPIEGMTQEETNTFLIGKVKEMVEMFGTGSLKEDLFFSKTVGEHPVAVFEVVYNFLEKEGAIQELFNQFCNGKYNSRRQTVLHEAARYNPEVALFLSQRHGELLSAEDTHFMTPLDFLDKEKHPEIYEEMMAQTRYKDQ